MNLLRADCDNCAGLCCVALAFTRSADFAFDKAAADPCVNLAVDSRCEIHPELRERGMRGCTVFDCVGAGQRVTAASGDWRTHPDGGGQVFAVFTVTRQLHELLWYLQQAIRMPAADALHGEVLAARAATEELASLPADELLAADVSAHRDVVVELLGRVSGVARAEAVRAQVARDAVSDTVGDAARDTVSDTVSDAARVGDRAEGDRAGANQAGADRAGANLAGADLIGANLAGADLRGATMRGAYLIAADLSGARLAFTDLIGADLRDTNLRGTDLSEAMFLTQPQVNAALGDSGTTLPPEVLRPAHWAR